MGLVPHPRLTAARRLLVVADVHLRGSGDPHEDAFIRFLDDVVAPDADATFVIGGDLCQFWFGRPGPVPRRWRRLVDALFSLPRVVWIEGNHDLRLDRVLPPSLDVRVGPQWFAVGERRVVVAHGEWFGPGGWAQGAFVRFLRSSVVAAIAGALGPQRTERIGFAAADRHGPEPYDGRDSRWLAAARAYARSVGQEGATDVIVGHGHWLGRWDGRLVCPGDWRRDHQWVEVTAAGAILHPWRGSGAPLPGGPAGFAAQ